MAKYKIEHSDERTLLVISGQKGDQLSEREFYAITTMQISCLVRADIVRKSKTFKLLYDISGFIPLREFLMNPLNKITFSNLLKGVLDNLKILRQAFFEERYLLLDVNAVMVNPLNQELKFIFVPISFFNNNASLKSFLLSIIDCCSFVQGESGDYVREYIRILNNGINFSVFELEEYVRRLSTANLGAKDEKKCNKCGAALEYNVNFCSLCGTRIGEIVVNNDKVYDPSKTVFQYIGQAATVSDIPANNQIEPISSPVASVTHGRMSIPAEWAIHKEQFIETAVIHQLYGNQAFLVDVLTGEKVAVNSRYFTIGKEQSNSFCISNNSAVSRNHAVIKNINGRWMISDINSTNFTYVNGNRVVPGQDVEIFNNTKITFANADYIFFKY